MYFSNILTRLYCKKENLAFLHISIRGDRVKDAV